MKRGIFERGATTFRFSKISIFASFGRSPLSFLFPFIRFNYKCNFCFFFFDIKTKKKFGSTKGLLDILSQLLAIYVTRLARFLTNYKRSFTICRTSWLSLRYITVVNASGTAQRCVM